MEYLLEFSSQTPVPIGNAYLTPETLGRDRLAAAVSRHDVLYPGRNVLIVDFGTAVTIDLVTSRRNVSQRVAYRRA
ncbi:MAG: type III pantothenate kinase [Bacteroides thetaiotaomicron]